jgi:hypothetical protein
VRGAAEAVKAVARDSPMENWHLGSPHTKAFLANGLDELRQVFHPGVEQIQPGLAPGLYGMPTTGEATHERLGDALDVPGKQSLDDLRGVVAERTAEAERTMDQPSLSRGREM